METITRCNDKSDHSEKQFDTDYEYETYFKITVDNGIETDLLMVVLAFPMLRFALEAWGQEPVPCLRKK